MKCRFDRVVAVLGSLFPPLLFSLSVAAAQTPVVRIGVVIDGPWERNEEVFGLFQAEIRALAGVEFDVRFPEEKTIVGNWTPAGSSEALDSLLADPEVDLVMAMGVMASDSACRRGDLPKPVVALRRKVQDVESGFSLLIRST